MNLTDFLLERINDDQTTTVGVAHYKTFAPFPYFRVLAECEAKRHVVSLHSAVHVCPLDETGDDERVWDQRHDAACGTRIGFGVRLSDRESPGSECEHECAQGRGEGFHGAG